MMKLDEVFNALRSHYAKKLPFVVYKKPSKDIVSALLVNETQLEYLTSSKQKGFVFAPFDNTSKPVIFNEHSTTALQAQINPLSYVPDEVKFHTPEDVNILYTNLVATCIEEIKNNHFEKIVLSRKKVVETNKMSPLDLYERLLKYNLSAFNYLWYHPEIGLWMGATPEFLLELNDDVYKTMALAGTKGFNSEWSAKEIKEHEYVVNYLLDILNPVSKAIEVDDIKTIKAGNVYHLQTLIKGTINSRVIDVLSLITSLHPTPAVCGYPKELAQEFILNNEGYDREFYCGYLGEFNMRTIENHSKHHTSLFVNLRCMKLEEKKANIYVGGGITVDSDPVKEWEETVAKSHAMMKLLNEAY